VTSTSGALTFGVKTSQIGISYEQILNTWREADELPAFEHAWLWDHMVPLRGDVRAAALEAWTLLAALAAQTRRLRLGVIVTNNRLRPPAVLAKMAATVDQISGGRLVFGIGAGGSRVADPAGLEIVRREFDAYGIDVVSPTDAVAALAEACTIVRRMWSEDEPFDFDGRYYQLKGTVCEPKPAQRPGPPIMIGAGGERRALRVVAEHADIWNSPTRTVDEFRHKSRILDEHCAAIGRDPATIVRSVQLLLRDTEPATVRGQLREYIEAGATHLVLVPMPPALSLRQLVEEIIEPVRDSAANL
jgi:alkanesulfonate monooxygenase SsuD/methylene tetrahydromethanopterin reductase-like flavin-dependent oxidoreductase (luciferase family)